MWAFYILLAILLTPTAVVVGVYASRIRFSRSIVARTQPAQQTPSRCRRVIVVAGDSTAFGVGALPAETTAGRIAAAFPHARVINIGRSGANVAGVLQQLDSLDIGHADMVLIQACANDVLEFRNLAKVEADLRAVLAKAKSLSSNVVLMPGHDFSRAPFFLRPISKLITWQAVRVHAIVKRVTQEMDVMFVDLFRHPTSEPFIREPHRYYCPDGLHPSAEGYAIWFSALLASVPLARLLTERSTGSD
jgi:lysophospholipase L1-like esterase